MTFNLIKADTIGLEETITRKDQMYVSIYGCACIANVCVSSSYIYLTLVSSQTMMDNECVFSKRLAV